MTTTIKSPSPSTAISTTIVTITPSTSAVTQTTTQFTTASLTSNTNTNTDILPPVRPTSTATDDGTNTFCPTGFYACLASAGGGCCQTGRDCHTTSCPPIAYTTIVNTDGVTIAVPATAVPTPSPSSHCADNWFLCGRDAGNVAGCCPSGYSCGTASCFLATGGATASVAKELPSRAERVSARWGFGGLVVGALTWAALLL